MWSRQAPTPTQEVLVAHRNAPLIDPGQDLPSLVDESFAALASLAG